MVLFSHILNTKTILLPSPAKKSFISSNPIDSSKLKATANVLALYLNRCICTRHFLSIKKVIQHIVFGPTSFTYHVFRVFPYCNILDFVPFVEYNFQFVDIQHFVCPFVSRLFVISFWSYDEYSTIMDIFNMFLHGHTSFLLGIYLVVDFLYQVVTLDLIS